MIALFFDTETNGIKTWDNPDFKLRTVQLGAILQDTTTGRVLGELNLIIDQQGKPIPVGASNVHGITDELAETVGVDKRIADALFAQMIDKADLIVAHNIQYDLDVLADDMPFSHSAVRDRPTFCTMQGSLYIVKAPLTDRQKAYFTSKGRMPDAPFKVPNLTETHMHFYGKPFEGAHDAMADIRACRDIFLTLLEQGYYQESAGAIVPTDKLDQLMATA
jgi:DNA polymerase-3 subunit epsilon